MGPERRPDVDFRRRNRRLRLGVIVSELFDPKFTGIGGFGWAARQVSRCFSGEQALGVDVVLLMTRPVHKGVEKPDKLHGSPILWRAKNPLLQALRLRAQKLDLLLAIDNQAIYRLFYWSLPRTPVIFWIRDPWPPADKAVLQALRIPGDPAPPQGLIARDLTNFTRDYTWSRRLGRPMVFAVPAQFLRAKIPATYGITPDNVTYLPNLIDLRPGRVTKTEKPTVVVLGRLDPVKRPWVAAALAERLPNVEFLFLGQNHFSGPGSWQPANLPLNVRLLGHVDGEEKTRLLSSAWMLLNTSIHEGLPVTFQEALACETPIVSCLDPERVVSHFGIFVGEAQGDGMDSLGRFEDAIRKLIASPSLRERFGREGRAWIESTHNRNNFIETFHGLCAQAGVIAQHSPAAATAP